LIQPFGTERVEMEIDYTSGGQPSDKDPETFTLTFSGGGKLSVTGATSVDKRSGTYTRNSSAGSGTFILDRK